MDQDCTVTTTLFEREVMASRREHLLQSGQDFCSRFFVDLTNPFDEPRLINCSYLIQDDLAFLAL